MGDGGLSDDKEAQARVAEFRQGWFRVGTSTERADRPRAEAAIARMYARLGAAPPPFLWCDSPMTAKLAMSVMGGRRSSRRTALWHSLPYELRDAWGDGKQALPLGVWLGDSLQISEAWLRNVLRASGKDWLTVALIRTVPSFAVRARLAVALEDPRWGSQRARELLESAVDFTLSRSLRARKIPYRRIPLQGQQQSDWTIPYRHIPLHGLLQGDWIERSLFDRDVLGIHYAPLLSDALDEWADLARSCQWWWPYRQICVVSERPAELHCLDGQRLHNDAGPAVSFRDGWSIWVIDGIPVDEQVVMSPETQTLPQIRRERNAEVKRIRIERYGWDRYLAAVGATVLDRRRNDIEATRESLMRGPDGERVGVRLPVDCTGLRIARSALDPDLRRGPELA